jgi:hypothetical protein
MTMTGKASYHWPYQICYDVRDCLLTCDVTFMCGCKYGTQNSDVHIGFAVDFHIVPSRCNSLPVSSFTFFCEMRLKQVVVKILESLQKLV